MSDFPSQFGRSPMYRDPEGTLPMPSPQDIPVAQWYAQWSKLRWAVTAIDENNPLPYPVGVLYTSTWTSPAFDLRPDLRSGNAGPKDGVPIWTPSGRLFVQMKADAQATGSQARLEDPVNNLQVQGIDWMNTTFNLSGSRAAADGVTGGAGLLRGTSIDVSSKFAAGGPATTAVAGFAPPGTTLGGGEGYPVRYWRLQLDFVSFFETGAPLPDPLPEAPLLMLQASMY